MKKDFEVIQIPSLIDMHVHFREPGFEYKETIQTGIQSAIAGGFSGVCTMPNTNPVTDNSKVIKEILSKAKKYHFEIYPVAAITKNLDSLELVDFKELKASGAIAFSNDGLPLLTDQLSYSKNLNEYLLDRCTLSKVLGVRIEGNTAVITTVLIPKHIWDKKQHIDTQSKTY